MRSLTLILKEVELDHQDSFSFKNIMMKKIIQITTILIFTSLTIFGQTRETKEADAFFENFSYKNAAEAYEELAEKNATEHVLKRLGDSYYLNVNMQKASESYATLFANFTPKESEYMFKYAQSLRVLGNFEASNIWTNKFREANRKASRGIYGTSKEASLGELKDFKGAYEVTNLRSINSVNSDFGATDYGNSILFSSPRVVNSLVKRINTVKEKKFLEIYTVKKENLSTKVGDVSKVSPLFSDLKDSELHESSVTFSPDNKTIYFTSNNYIDGKFLVDKEGYNNLKILKADWVLDKWDNIVELPFCNNEYSVGHPSLSKDGKRLYFVSDMPGGMGKTDIYVVDIYKDGVYGAIQNLGISVNTEEREMFPFISDDDVLYFSSDGHIGKGDLDVFATKKAGGFFKTPVNLNFPINTKSDDFAFSINPATKKGYLSSNREGGAGDDDIYEVLEIDEPCTQTVSIIAREVQFKNTLPYVKLHLKDAVGNIIKDTITDEQGRLSFKLPCNQKFTIEGSKEYYRSDTEHFATSEKATFNLALDLFLEITEDFGYTKSNELIIKINPIYFNYNKWDIRPDAMLELDHIVKIMTKYPKIIVVSASYTDARGKSSYNELLSQRRAKSAVNYIFSRGISSDRIYGKGYGESNLTNQCIDNDSHSNSIKCSEAQHQENRRTSFIVLNVDGTKISSEVEKGLSASERDSHMEKPESIYKTHLVGEGETLYFISKKYNLSLGLLKQINTLTGNNVYVNQLLIIDPGPNTSKNINKVLHTVKALETLYAIGQQYNILVERLKSLNGLTNNVISIGQVLRIK